MMILTNRVLDKKDQFYHYETELADHIITLIDSAMANPLMTVFRFVLALPVIYSLSVISLILDGLHLQFMVCSIILVAEVVNMYTQDSKVLSFISIPVRVFNFLVWHPVASLGLAFAFPLDVINIIVNTFIPEVIKTKNLKEAYNLSMLKAH